MNRMTLSAARMAAAVAIIFGVTLNAAAEHGDPPAAAIALHVVGETLSLTIPAPIEESEPIQWFKDDVALANGGAISGAQARTLQVSALTLGDAGVYSAEYQEHAKHGLTYTVAVFVALQRLPFAMGDTLSLTVPEPVEESLPIHWHKNGEELAPGGGIGGIGSRTLYIPSLDHDHAGVYYAEYEEHAKHGNTFGPFLVTVVHEREIVLLGETLALDVPPPFVEPVEWFKDGVLLADGGRVSGAETGALRISGAEVEDGGVYTASYAGHAKHHHTHDVRVYVVAEHVERNTGDSFSLTIPEPVEESLPINWYRDGVQVSDVGHLSGSGTPTLSISPVGPRDSGVYWAEYEEHAKHAATLEPVMLTVVNNNTPIPGLPLASGAGLAALVGALSVAGAFARRK